MRVAARFAARALARHVAISTRLRPAHAAASARPHADVVFVWDFDERSVPEAEALVVYDRVSALLGAPAELAAAALGLPYRKVVVSSWLKRRLAEAILYDKHCPAAARAGWAARRVECSGERRRLPGRRCAASCGPRRGGCSATARAGRSWRPAPGPWGGS